MKKTAVYGLDEQAYLHNVDTHSKRYKDLLVWLPGVALLHIHQTFRALLWVIRHSFSTKFSVKPTRA